MTAPFARPEELAGRIDHAILRADVTREDARLAARGCAELRLRGLAVPPWLVETAAEELADSDVRVIGVIGFPLGFQTAADKQFEALECQKHGAAELDVVINLGALKGGELARVEKEVSSVMDRTPECVHKIIIETGALEADEVLRAVDVVNRARPRFIKTCTGYGPRGVTVADLELIRTRLDAGILIKASAGIRTLDAALQLTRAGASVLGTSASAAILTELTQRLQNPKEN